MAIKGLGPRGERASTLQQLQLSDRDAGRLRAKQHTVVVLLHSPESDWSRQQLAGIASTLGLYSAKVVEVIDCAFDTGTQNEALLRLAQNPPSAVISIPIGNAEVADAHRTVSRSGAKLTLLESAPTGLLPGTDYAALVSADNFGLGEIAAELLSPHIPTGSPVGIVAYSADFYATRQREMAFRKWMAHVRPDVTVRAAQFTDVNQAGPAVDRLLADFPSLAGLFTVWVDPAMQTVAALKAAGRHLPVTTVDLGLEAAIDMAGGGMIKGIGAQRPYDQGDAAATLTLLALAGREPPRYVALPGLSVTADNLRNAYQTVWHTAAPPALAAASQATRTASRA